MSGRHLPAVINYICIWQDVSLCFLCFSTMNSIVVHITYVNCVFCPVRRMRGVVEVMMDESKAVAGWDPAALCVD